MLFGNAPTSRVVALEVMGGILDWTDGSVYRLIITVILEKQSKNSKIEDGAFTHILLLNYEAQKLIIIYFLKETSKQLFNNIRIIELATQEPITYNIIR